MKYFNMYVITFKRLFPTCQSIFEAVTLAVISQIKDFLSDEKLTFLSVKNEWEGRPTPAPGC